MNWISFVQGFLWHYGNQEIVALFVSNTSFQLQVSDEKLQFTKFDLQFDGFELVFKLISWLVLVWFCEIIFGKHKK